MLTSRWPGFALTLLRLALMVLVIAGTFLGFVSAAAASFTLTGTVACGALSGKHCQLSGNTLTIISDDSGSAQPYTIDIAWIRRELDGLDQDDLVRIEIERQPDGTLKAIGLVNVSGVNGAVRNSQRDREDDPAPAADSAPGLPPIAHDDSYVFLNDSPQNVPAATGLLANDILNGATLTPFVGLTSQGNTVQVNADGSFTWTPSFAYNPSDPDLLTYTITNANGSSQATVSFGIIPL
ncbi:MAG: Ig-like domain-containing protein [Chloroflexota bacterium]